MNGLIDLIQYLQSKYSKPLSLKEFLEKRYGNGEDSEAKEETVTGEDTGTNEAVAVELLSEETSDIKEEGYLIFACDAEHNRDCIHQLLDSFDEIRRDAFASGRDEAEIKLLNKYSEKLEKLLESECLSDGEKTAKELKKILESTLTKLGKQKYFANSLIKYLKKNKIWLEEYAPGQQLSDEEIENLDIRLAKAFIVETDKKEDSYKVIEMIQPTVKIFYMDDDELDCFCIEGCCRYYQYSARK